MNEHELDLDSILSSRKSIIQSAPEDSVIGKVLPLETEPGIVIYGPTKGGKTRLAAWEATALASKLNRRVLMVMTESNIEQEDVRDLVYACAYHDVECSIYIFHHLKGLAYFAKKMANDVEKAMRKDKEHDVIEAMPRVVVIDSLSGLSNLVIEGLSENIVESGAPTVLPYVYPYLAKVVNPLRRVLSAEYLNGYLIMVSQETQLRGEKYMPGAPVKSKPKYSGAAQYNDDAEVYLGNPAYLPESLKTCRDVSNSPELYRPLIVATSRRNPSSVGRGVAVKFVRLGEEGEPAEREGTLERSEATATIVYKYTPRSLLPDESVAKRLVAKPVVPVVGCGPKDV